MSTYGSVKQPVGQVRMTNVATIRLKVKGTRFEIAAYRNKVLSWRDRIEKDINEVLQVPTVFTNVSRGIIASGKELMEAFGSEDHSKICSILLDRGEMEVSGKMNGGQESSL